MGRTTNRATGSFSLASGLKTSQQTLAFANNLKRTALGVKFAKTLYTNPGSLNAKTVTQVLKALGYQVPQGVEIAVDAAQVIAGA